MQSAREAAQAPMAALCTREAQEVDAQALARAEVAAAVLVLLQPPLVAVHRSLHSLQARAGLPKANRSQR